ncbi:MAG: CPBP family intramembrane metalloprotease [Planctomycetes bacterium]|nr:CPBP family intramembrane metalloprotease [Planctomycetota bacterium]
MPSAAESTFTLEPSLALFLAAICGVVGGVCLVLLLAPRWAWPDRVRGVPERPEEAADWKWPWLVGLPPLIVALQLVGFPLKWAGVRPTLWLAFGVSIGSGLVCVLLAWQMLCRRLRKPASALGLRMPHWKPHLVLLPVLGYPLGLSLMFLAILFQIAVLKQPLPPPQDSMKAIRAITDPALRILAIVAVTVAAPVAEEILFRGVLFRGLRFRWGFVPAMVVSAAVFSLAHLDLDHAGAIFMLGLVLAFVTAESESLYPGMVLHAIVNSVAVWAAWKFPMA